MTNTIQNWLDNPTSVDSLYAIALEAIAPAKLRLERNKLLVESDWTQVVDSPLTTANKTQWATYRQALRDLPASSSPTIDVDENLVNVTFPTKP
tara:strand:- start:200 stop:481 length:282 start_codon:yes stop_codon:yes gene_type:complete